MKHLLAIGLLLASLSSPVLAAKNSQAFSLPWDVRVGETRIPQGRCKISWTDASGGQVQLTIQTSDSKTVTLPARVIQEKPLYTGPLTFEVNGVRQLKGFSTKEATFIVQEAPKDAK